MRHRREQEHNLVLLSGFRQVRNGDINIGPGPKNCGQLDVWCFRHAENASYLAGLVGIGANGGMNA